MSAAVSSNLDFDSEIGTTFLIVLDKRSTAQILQN